MLEIRMTDDELPAQSEGLSGGHRASHSELARLIGRGGDDSSRTVPTYGDRSADQRTVTEPFGRDKKRIKVDVKDDGHGSGVPNGKKIDEPAGSL